MGSGELLPVTAVTMGVGVVVVGWIKTGCPS